jgi:hypothetical protein
MFVSCIAYVCGKALQFKVGLGPLILDTLGVVPFYIILSLILSGDIGFYLFIFICCFE